MSLIDRHRKTSTARYAAYPVSALTRAAVFEVGGSLVNDVLAPGCEMSALVRAHWTSTVKPTNG